jgi:hypothetical protein
MAARRWRFRVALDSLEDDATHSYDCVAPDGLLAGVFLPAGQEAADDMTVEARLVIIDWPPGFGLPGFREYRLLDACGSAGEVIVRPRAANAFLGHRAAFARSCGRRARPAGAVGRTPPPAAGRCAAPPPSA